MGEYMYLELAISMIISYFICTKIERIKGNKSNNKLKEPMIRSAIALFIIMISMCVAAIISKYISEYVGIPLFAFVFVYCWYFLVINNGINNKKRKNKR